MSRLVDKILKEINSIEFIYSKEIMYAIANWVMYSSVEEAKEAGEILKHIDFPGHLKADNKTLYRLMALKRNTVFKMIKGSTLTTNELSSWTFSRMTAEGIMNHDFHSESNKGKIEVLLKGSFSNTLVDISKYLSSYIKFEKDEDIISELEELKEDVDDEQEVIVKQSVLTKDNIVAIFDSKVDEYNWIKLKDYIKYLK